MKQLFTFQGFPMVVVIAHDHLGMDQHSFGSDRIVFLIGRSPMKKPRNCGAFSWG